MQKPKVIEKTNTAKDVTAILKQKYKAEYAERRGFESRQDANPQEKRPQRPKDQSTANPVSYAVEQSEDGTESGVSQGFSSSARMVDNAYHIGESDRVLPITAETLPYFERHLQYLDGRRAVTPPPPGDLLFYRENGEIYNQSHISRGFNEFLKHCGLPHLRFHDLRHTAATNMHELTGDYYTVGKILGHSLKGVSERLGVDGVGKTMTQRYIDVRTNRMNTVLSTYHKAIQPKKPKGKSRPELER